MHEDLILLGQQKKSKKLKKEIQATLHAYEAKLIDWNSQFRSVENISHTALQEIHKKLQEWKGEKKAEKRVERSLAQSQGGGGHLAEVKEFPYKKQLEKEFQALKEETEKEFKIKEEIEGMKIDLINMVRKISPDEVMRTSGI